MAITINGNGTVTGLSQLPDSAMAAGSILQVKQTIKGNAFESSQTVGGGYADITGLSLDITPSSTSSNIYVMATLYNSNTNAVNFFRI